MLLSLLSLSLSAFATAEQTCNNILESALANNQDLQGTAIEVLSSIANREEEKLFEAIKLGQIDHSEAIKEHDHITIIRQCAMYLGMKQL